MALEGEDATEIRSAHDAFVASQKAAKKQMPKYQPVWRTAAAYAKTAAAALSILTPTPPQKEAVVEPSAQPPRPPPTTFDPDAFMAQLQSQQAAQLQAMVAQAQKAAAEAATAAAQQLLAQRAPEQPEAPKPPELQLPAITNTLQQLRPSSPALTIQGSVGASATASNSQLTQFQQQLKALEAEKAYEDEMMRQRQQQRAAQIAKLQFQINANMPPQ
jgi:nucleotide-binding universal stress UspA family protein